VRQKKVKKEEVEVEKEKERELRKERKRGREENRIETLRKRGSETEEKTKERY
jgi:hypothetical protein